MLTGKKRGGRRTEGGPPGPEVSQDSNSVLGDTLPQNCGVKDANASRTITKSRKILLVKPNFPEVLLDNQVIDKFSEPGDQDLRTTPFYLRLFGNAAINFTMPNASLKRALYCESECHLDDDSTPALFNLRWLPYEHLDLSRPSGVMRGTQLTKKITCSNFPRPQRASQPPAAG